MKYRGMAKVHIVRYKRKEAVYAECHCGWLSEDAANEAELFVIANSHAVSEHGHPLHPQSRQT